MALVVSPLVIFSYPHFFVATQNKKGLAEPDNVAQKRGKYTPFMFSGAFLFTQEAMDSPETKAMQAEYRRACIERFGAATFETLIREDAFDGPFRKDVSSKGYPEHVVRYITCSTGADHPPQVVSTESIMVDGKLKPKPITDPAAIYPGAIGKVSVVARAYGGLNTGNKAGCKFDLRNVQKWHDGPRLASGGSDAADDFGPGNGVAPAANLRDLMD